MVRADAVSERCGPLSDGHLRHPRSLALEDVAYPRGLEWLKAETRRVDFMVMILLVAALAIAGVVAMSIWCVLATAEMVYGYPVGRHLIRKTIGRLDERQFLASDIEDLDAAFAQVASSHPVTD